jgi:hypothetical protein
MPRISETLRNQVAEADQLFLDTNNDRKASILLDLASARAQVETMEAVQELHKALAEIAKEIHNLAAQQAQTLEKEVKPTTTRKSTRSK